MTTTAAFLGLGVLAVWILMVLRWSQRGRRGDLEARSRLHWAYVGGLVALLVASVGAMLEVLVGWPPDSSMTIVVAATVLPLGLVLGASARLRPWAARVLAHTIVVVGLMLMVGAVYVVTVIGLGRVPERQERTVLLLSMGAAGVAALLVVPARRRLEGVHRTSHRRSRSDARRRPEDVLRPDDACGTDGRIAPAARGVAPVGDGAHVGGDLDRDGGGVDEGRFGTGATRHSDRADRRGAGGGRPFAGAGQQLGRRVAADAARGSFVDRSRRRSRSPR